MPDLVPVLRASADRYRSLLEPMSEEQVTAPSYDDDWTVADVASHLGSGAEIFAGFLDAGVAGEEPPGNDSFTAIWDRWNATPPARQTSESLATNESFVSRVESLSPEQRDAFTVPMFGMDAGLTMLLGMRIGEMTFHTWDIAVMGDPGALLPQDAVGPMVDNVAGMLGRAMKPVPDGPTVAVTTSDPERHYVLDLAAAAVAEEGTDGTATIQLPAEAFLRLVAGRLDPDHTPAEVQATPDVLDALRQAFPGF